jgi:hypothetical protein
MSLASRAQRDELSRFSGPYRCEVSQHFGRHQVAEVRSDRRRQSTTICAIYRRREVAEGRRLDQATQQERQREPSPDQGVGKEEPEFGNTGIY